MRSWSFPVSLALWFLVGACFGAGLAALPSFGLFVLPVAIAATVALAQWRPGRPGWPTIFAGFAVSPLYIAYLNRSGPGNVCTTTATSSSCVSEWSPWPFLAAGLLLIAVTLVAIRWSGRRSPGP